MKGIELEKLTWLEAEKVLTPDSVVVIPLGAGLKEHGPHLPLNNDWLTAEHFKNILLAQCDVVIVPTISYCFYPAFIEYAGTVSISRETSAAVIVDICESLSQFGPRRFYVWNNGISTALPLADAVARLHRKGLLLHYTDLHSAYASLPAGLSQQDGGSHADELETSLMLEIAPQIVNMELACKDFHSDARGRLTRNPDAGLSYSPSGVWGDARLASKEKGIMIVECLSKYLVNDIEKLRRTPVSGA